MSTVKNREEKSEVDELQSSLSTETELRLEAEDRLQCAEEEFEQFILTAAHDLKEPLRAVSAYSELLAKKFEDRPDPEAEQYRRYILEGTGRMQALVAGMVDYATAQSDGLYLAVDMNEIFREAASLVGPQLQGRAIEITRDPLPIVKGDPEKMVKVARHLLDNAARYCESDQCLIHVSSQPEDSEWLFVVRDNGPGIDEAYQGRIFEPFRRLHGRQYPGTGLGLPYCRKTIEAHGGRMWVESRPGQGSTFCFTLPCES